MSIETAPIFYWLKSLETKAPSNEIEFIRYLQNAVLVLESTAVAKNKNSTHGLVTSLDEALMEVEALEEENMMLETDLSIANNAIKELQEQRKLQLKSSKIK